MSSSKTKSPAPVRVAIYTRVSDERTGQDTTNQRDQLTRYIEEQGWKLVEEYSDNERGWNPARSRLKDLLRDAQILPRKFDRVMFWSLDRLSREGATATLNYLQVFDQAGIGWKSFTEPYLDTGGMFKDVLVAMLASLAKQETTRISERVRAGIDRVRKEGRRVGRAEVAVDVDALKVMVDSQWSIGRMAKALGVSKATVCRRLKAAGLETAHTFTPGAGTGADTGE